MTLCDLTRNCKGEVFISLVNKDGSKNLIEIVPTGYLGISKDERIQCICKCKEGV